MNWTSGSPYSHGAICFPSLFVVVVWVGLWWLWPPVGGDMAHVRGLPPSRVRAMPMGAEDAMMYRNPTLFARSLGTGTAGPEPGGRERPGDAAGPPALMPRFLPMPAPRYLAAGMASAARLEAPAVGRSAALFSEAPVFPPASGQGARVVVEVSPALAERGFKAPADLINRVQEFGKPCMVVLSVEIDADGRCRSVFVETPSGFKEFDSAVVRLVREGEAVASGRACAGRVTVSGVSP